jgi:hypothetical protein
MGRGSQIDRSHDADWNSRLRAEAADPQSRQQECGHGLKPLERRVEKITQLADIFACIFDELSSDRVAPIDL